MMLHHLPSPGRSWWTAEYVVCDLEVAMEVIFEISEPVAQTRAKDTLPNASRSPTTSP